MLIEVGFECWRKMNYEADGSWKCRWCWRNSRGQARLTVYAWINVARPCVCAVVDTVIISVLGAWRSGRWRKHHVYVCIGWVWMVLDDPDMDRFAIPYLPESCQFQGNREWIVFSQLRYPLPNIRWRDLFCYQVWTRQAVFTKHGWCWVFFITRSHVMVYDVSNLFRRFSGCVFGGYAVFYGGRVGLYHRRRE